MRIFKCKLDRQWNFIQWKYKGFWAAIVSGHSETRLCALTLNSRRGGDMAIESEDSLPDASTNMCRMGDWCSLVREETSSSLVWIDKNKGFFWTKATQGKEGGCAKQVWQDRLIQNQIFFQFSNKNYLAINIFDTSYFNHNKKIVKNTKNVNNGVRLVFHLYYIWKDMRCLCGKNKRAIFYCFFNFVLGML